MTSPTAIENTDAIRALLEEVHDPEIPVLSILDLGLVRDLRCGEGTVEVTITPTYSGCPAMTTIAWEIERRLHEAGWPKVTVRTVLAPAWTTDWMSEAGREKLRAYGIAPPAPAAERARGLLGETASPSCPRCGSSDCERISEFGSTACKALWRCRTCLEPFDYFKCI